jgi:hypothetical protein
MINSFKIVLKLIFHLMFIHYYKYRYHSSALSIGGNVWALVLIIKYVQH